MTKCTVNSNWREVMMPTFIRHILRTSFLVKLGLIPDCNYWTLFWCMLEAVLRNIEQCSVYRRENYEKLQSKQPLFSTQCTLLKQVPHLSDLFLVPQTTRMLALRNAASSMRPFPILELCPTFASKFTWEWKIDEQSISNILEVSQLWVVTCI